MLNCMQRLVRGWGGQVVLCCPVLFSTLVVLCGPGCDGVASLDLPKEGAALQEGGDEANPPVANPAEQARAQDQEAARILAGKGEDGEHAVDTEEFFSKPEKYAIWKGDPALFKKLFAEMRAAGAPATHAICSEAFGASEVAASYIITLPQEAGPRKKVIDLYNAFWNDLIEQDLEDIDPSEKEEYRRQLMEEVGSELATDSGQKYIILMFDP